MTSILTFVSPLLLLLSSCESANFLFSFYHDKGSHFGSMKPLMESLAKKGHSVTFLDTIFDPDKSPSPLLRRVRAQLPQRNEDEQSKRAFANFLWHHRFTAHNLVKYYKGMDQLFGTLLLNHSEQVVELVNEDWDFIVLDDLFWSFGFALGMLKHRLWELNGKQSGKQPHVVFYATAAQSLMSAESTKSVGRNWVSRATMCPPVPTDAGDVFSPNKFAHRLNNFYENYVDAVLINTVIPSLMPNIARLGVPNFSWYEMFSRQSLELSDSIDRLGWPLAFGTEMTNVGAHCKTAGNLSKELADFVQHPESKGTIYVAFGTLADWSMAPERVTDAMFRALNRLRQFRVIFVYNGPPVPGLGPHVLLTRWAPQLEVLAHPRTRAFISHGGNKSIREGICAGVPLIVMPIYAEQAHTAHLLLGRRLAPAINKFTMSEQSVFNAINGVVSSPESVAVAQKMRRMFLDRPMPALEEGMFAMERLLRKKGDNWREFTQRRGMHLQWSQFAYLDWFLVLTAICSLINRR